MRHLPIENRAFGIFAISIATLFISTVQADNYLTQTPTFLQPCKLYDSGNGQCLTDLLQDTFIKWNGDISGAKAVPSIDPLKLKELHLDQTSPVTTLYLDAQYIVATGLGNTMLSNCSVQYGEDFKCNLKIPKFHIEGDYTMKGRILVLDINGKGPFSFDMSDIAVRLSFKTETVVRDGERFLDLLTLKTAVTSFGDIHVQYGNLFGEDQDELTNSTNDLFNGNRDELVVLYTPVVEEILDTFLFHRTNKILRRIPANYIFTDFTK